MKLFQAAFLLCGICACTLLAQTTALASKHNEMLVYFGTFTRSGSKGIYLSRLDLASGKLSQPELAAEIGNCGFLAIHPNKKFLYSVGDLKIPTDKPAGGVNAFSIDSQNGKLTFLNQQSSGGRGPAHLTVDHKGKSVLVANYGGGSVAALPIQPDGHLAEASSFIQHTGSSVHPSRQKEPHAHVIQVSPDNRFAFVADLGLDKVLIYKLDAAKGLLAPNDPAFASVPPGAGPRHFSFHPNGRFAYVINELDCTVTAFDYNKKRGALNPVQTLSTLPTGQSVESSFSTAEVVVHPSGKFLYGSNRGHDTIAVFTVDQKTGKLDLIQNEPTQGNIPRNFNIDPTGKFLLAANQNSDNVVVFRIDAKSGRLTPTGNQITVPMPVCVKFLAIE
ncbi:MAG: lactonase family protein [Verrucomicrobia bacterium]|nr:lactonase family protein [Verrucomicrobiota bacterium]